MTQHTEAKKKFLFLQGPHGPFFNRLGRMLRMAGADTYRVGFNAGDQFFWSDAKTYMAFTDTPEAWPGYFSDLIARLGITDIVLYGDTRPIHAEAVKTAQKNGLQVHVFEEGYLRPYWVTYERGGTNGHSRLMGLSVENMREALAGSDHDRTEAPDHWGDMRQHVYYGALYHWFVMFRNQQYSQFRRHRDLPVSREFQLYFKRLLLMPLHWADRTRATARIRNGGYPYHLALLQLEHDSSFVMHSPFAEMSEFLNLVIEGFASSAPRHHHLVFKAHPLETGRRNLRGEILEIATKYGVSDRVHHVRGGKLAALLDHARSAVTVNSTAGQQVLWRGLPLKVFGEAVYDKPEFVSTQPITEFFKSPHRPTAGAYGEFRQYLLETSQIAGGFYSLRGRRQLLRLVVDLMLAADDPYDALLAGTAAPRQALRVVS
ncbi:capsule biosynthesis protein [Candidatus Halocynthiibacter alkanivorans]|uniref:capsule biosynthesis protein n=1 Tax=Candidatus Halocynthiibacter alkanivorans TaxID=2267619 RepID=UPI000DF471DC|nr:capsular biosynthesis protein [Candidatus Halocynthiibacter alkanivorans]